MNSSSSQNKLTSKHSFVPQNQNLHFLIFVYVFFFLLDECNDSDPPLADIVFFGLTLKALKTRLLGKVSTPS